eukprot:gene2643-2809_t
MKGENHSAFMNMYIMLLPILAFFSVVDSYFVITSLSSSNSASLNVGRIVSDPSNYNGSFGFTSSSFYLNADSVQLAVPKNNISSYQYVSGRGGSFYGNDVSSPKLYKLLTNEDSSSSEPIGELDALELIDPSTNDVSQRVVLSQPIYLGFGSAIFSGDGVILAADRDTHTVYSIDVHTGDVNVTSGCLLRWQTTNSFLSQGIAETNTSSFSIVYGNSNGNIERQSLLDSDVTTISNLEFDRLGMITMDMTSQRWWFYYAGHGPFDDNSASRNESLILGYADATYQTQPNSAPAITQITVTTTTTTAVLSCSFQLKSPYGGTVYCAAYDATMTTPPTPTASNIIAAGFSMSFQALQTVVNVTIVGLSAATDYHTFCYVLSNNQEGSSVQEIQNTERFIQTKCCKTVSYSNQPLFVYSNPNFYSSNTARGSGNTISAVTSFNNYLYTFVFVLSALPNRNITIIPRIYDTQTSEVLSSSILKVVPDIFTFTNSSPSKQGSFTLQPQVLNITQKYLLILNVTGVSASQYRASSSYFYLLNSTTIPSPPKLSNAIFGDSGTDAYYVFDSPTNAGGYNYQQTFRCSNIFAFQNANLSSCYWLNATTVRALFPSSILMNTNTSRLINVGDIITVLANRIKSQCSLVIPWLLTSCAGVPYAPQSSTLLAAPYHPTPPVLVIAAPAAVASCVDLVIDTTASSGNCNRPFLSAVWSVYSIDGNADLVALMKFMNKYNPDVYRIYTIPRGSLGTGSYTFSLTVQNFLGQVATSSVTVLASSNPNIPQLMIKNGQSMEIFANQRLIVNSFATIPSCPSSSVGASLQFTWGIYYNSALSLLTDSLFPNEGSDPTSYELKSYTLSAGSSYVLKVTVDSILKETNLATASNQIKITVKYGTIQAIIAGGDERYVPSDRFLILDGTKSRDQDLPSTKANFIFSWSCSLVSFYQFNTPCDGIFESEVTETTGRNKGKVVIRGDLVQPDYSYSVQLIIATDDGRTSSTSVIIKHSESNNAYTEITNLLKRFNSDANLTVNGMVQANTSVALSWRAFTADENITLVTYTPIELGLPVEYVNQPFSFPIVVKASTFSPGMAITFQLLAAVDHGSNSTTSSSAITLIANGPP